jgi:hypothetical protein
MTKKKNPTDATMRNVRAAKRREAKVNRELAALRVDLDILAARFEQHLSFDHGTTQTISWPRAKKR